MSIDEAERGHQRELFETYHRTRDLAIRDQLVAANLRLALHLARRFDHRGVPLDDLEQVASVGLVHAVERFEPHRGLEFSTFATPTIMGELKRHFRDKGWSVRVPRRVQELHLRLNSLVADLTHQLGRSPTIAELAVAARASEEEVLEAMEAAQAYRSALDRLGGRRTRGDRALPSWASTTWACSRSRTGSWSTSCSPTSPPRAAPDAAAVLRGDDPAARSPSGWASRRCTCRACWPAASRPVPWRRWPPRTSPRDDGGRVRLSR